MLLLFNCKREDNIKTEKDIDIWEQIYSYSENGLLWYNVLNDPDTIIHTLDFIYYNGLKIKNLSYEQIIEKYGEPNHSNIQIYKYGLDEKGRIGSINDAVYSLIWNLPKTEIKHCVWDNVDTIRTLDIYFLKKNGKWKTIFGYQINHETIMIE